MENEEKTPSDISKEIELKVLREIEAYWKGGDNFDDVYLTPKLTDLYRSILVSWYSRDNEEMAAIEKRRPSFWQTLRKASKSDKVAEMKYDSTADGQRRIELRYELKSLEKLISALKDRLHRFEMEIYHIK
jgi:hypothetical protein